MSDPDQLGATHRARALGRELMRVHDWLRTELKRLRGEIDTYIDNAAVPANLLQAHCLAFCSSLTQHHTTEDATTFPLLARQLPQLASVLDELRRDHRLVESILHRLRDLLVSLTPETVESARREIDGLTAILESHFQWEERRLVDALDALDTTQTVIDLFGVNTSSSTLR